MKFQFLAQSEKILILAAVIAFTSCKKNDITPTSDNNAATLSDSSTTADNMYNDVLTNAFVSTADNASIWSASNTQKGKPSINSTSGVSSTSNLGCAIYSFDDSVQGEYPKVLTVDFGTGCTSVDGIY